MACENRKAERWKDREELKLKFRQMKTYGSLFPRRYAAGHTRMRKAGSGKRYLSGANLAATKMPGHWLLARLKKLQPSDAVQLLWPDVHELYLVPDSLDRQIKEEIEQALSRTIHVGVRPLIASEWRAVLETEASNCKPKPSV